MLLAALLFAPALAAHEPPTPLPTALLATNVNEAELRARAMAGLDHPDRRMVRWMVRNELPVHSLERHLAHQSVVLVHQGVTTAVWRVLDRHGTADWLRVELDAEGALVDWTWLSEGLSASEKLADRASGGTGARSRAEAIEDLVLVAPEDLPQELAQLHSAYPGEVWADLNALEPYYRSEDWANFEATLDRLGPYVSNDPWIEWLHAVAMKAAGRKEEAELRKAMAESFDPSLSRQAYTPGKTRHG